MLPTLSKIFESLRFAQISAFFDNVFSKYQCAFWRGYGIQNFYLKMLEKWEKCVGKGKFFGALLTDLS